VAVETFIRSVEVVGAVPAGEFPFTIPAIRTLVAEGMALDAPVTYLVGENGSGKSTLVEALAIAAGFNPEGGSANLQFETRASESSLASHLRLVRGSRRERTGFFLRAESFFNVATAIEELPGDGLRPYGGKSLHEQSHGESFIALVLHRFGAGGLYLLDEPEAALSPQNCLTLLRRIDELVKAGSQFVVATHSPLLLAYPGARIYALDESGLETVSYDDAPAVSLTRTFLDAPERFLRQLLRDD
jgi:predicted ATPase